MKRIVHTVSIILAVLLAAAGGYYGGRRSVQPMVGTTFYAVIEEIRENRLLVQGLEINDINGRGTFELAVGDKTELIWRGVPITVKDLRVGNTVSVTYIGEVLEISPAQVSDVLRIQLLDDETPYESMPGGQCKIQSKMASRGTGHFRRRYFVFYGV